MKTQDPSTFHSIYLNEFLSAFTAEITASHEAKLSATKLELDSIIAGLCTTINDLR